MQIYALNQLSGHQNNAIAALFKLQSLGVTEDRILKVCSILEECSPGRTSGSKQVQKKNHIQAKRTDDEILAANCWILGTIESI